jgi:hypothetical protein
MGMRITEAAGCLDGVVGEVRQYVFARHARQALSGSAGRLPPDPRPSGADRGSRGLAGARLAQTAHELRLAASDAAASLEQRADLAGQPARIDYPTEIKRWRVVADQAEKMAKRWEQQT